jgi:hypothetical protein
MAASPTGSRSTSTGSSPRSSRRKIRRRSSNTSTAFWCPAASASVAEGKIRAARFARERKVPYFGICFGMQMAVIEGARSLAGIEAANSTEFGPCTEPVVGPDDRVAARATNWRLAPPAAISAAPCGWARMNRPDWPRARASRDLWLDHDFGAASPPLRGQHGLPDDAGSQGHALCRHVA